MDQHLRIIANPYRLKKSRLQNKTINLRSIENNNLLYKYLELKYRDIYISPVLFYSVIKDIDKIVLDHEINIIINEIITNVIHTMV